MSNEVKLIGKFSSSKYEKTFQKATPRKGQLFLGTDDNVYKAEQDFKHTTFEILTEKPKVLFTKGENVYSRTYGYGTVVSIDTHPHFPVNVEFENDCGVRSFTADGYYHFDRKEEQKITSVPTRICSCFSSVSITSAPIQFQYANFYPSRSAAREAITGKEIQSMVRVKEGF